MLLHAASIARSKALITMAPARNTVVPRGGAFEPGPLTTSVPQARRRRTLRGSVVGLGTEKMRAPTGLRAGRSGRP
jgi:hypothetical protein